MPIDRACAIPLLKNFDFRKLFLEELGWDKYSASLAKTVDGVTYNFQAISEKRSVVVFRCDRIPERSIRFKLDNLVAKDHFEHLIIFADQQQGRQIWQWTRREPGKPNAMRACDWSAHQTPERLIQKLENLIVTLDDEDETGMADVLGRLRTGFDVEKVTKKFYERFKTEHARFLKFVDGIPDEHLQTWYASVMINRLMFLYFIQAKGFLAGDRKYLPNKLKETRGQEKTHTTAAFSVPSFSKVLPERGKSERPR